jgi:hypothetical protein
VGTGLGGQGLVRPDFVGRYCETPGIGLASDTDALQGCQFWFSLSLIYRNCGEADARARVKRLFNCQGGAAQRSGEEDQAHLHCVSISSSQYGNGGAKLKKASPSVRNSRAIALPFAAASALLAGRRGDLQRAGENSRCWEILRATPHGICRTIERIGGAVRRRAFPNDSGFLLSLNPL